MTGTPIYTGCCCRIWKREERMLLYYYVNPLSPSSGMQSQLPILLAEYTFRSKQDVDDYLSLLDQTDSYFEGIASYLKDQSAQGLFMPDYSVDKIIAQCDTIMDKTSLEAGTHFLNTTFEERLDHLIEKRRSVRKKKKQPIFPKIPDCLLPLCSPPIKNGG